MLGGELADVEQALGQRLPAPIYEASTRFAPFRGLAIAHLAGRDGPLVLGAGERGAGTAIAASALLRRRIVLLELIAPTPSPSVWREALRRTRRCLLRPAARRVVLAAQVLTAAERAQCSRAYGIAESRVQHLPWAWCHDASAPPREGEREGVLASGRAACDWPTLFAAAAGSDWPLTVVCGRRDLDVVRTLNRDGRARVEVELPRRAHDEAVRGARAYVIPLRHEPGSAGQVRLAAATQARTPVVASAVPALAGYVIGDETALTVPAGDPDALRAGIERLLANPGLGSSLATRSFERAKTWPYPAYFDAVRQLIETAIAGRPLPARAPAAPV
jgi:glycosyltransferase involved in cell wall biosynthesis